MRLDGCDPRGCVHSHQIITIVTLIISLVINCIMVFYLWGLGVRTGWWEFVDLCVLFKSDCPPPTRGSNFT